MRRVCISERASVHRGDGSLHNGKPSVGLEPVLYDRLYKFDHTQRTVEDTIFQWGDRCARAKQWVGVVQMHGLQIEILPKIDTNPTEGTEDFHNVRANLLAMLSMSGEIPVRERENADLFTRNAPLSETLIAIFAKRLHRELLRGHEQDYQSVEENTNICRGKLCVAQHLRVNSANRAKFYCRSDEFNNNTLLNQVFKAALRLLLKIDLSMNTLSILRECVLILDSVSDVAIQPSIFSTISFTRQNERFREAFHFACLVLKGYSPAVEAGDTPTFSLLFDMEDVFERFIASAMATYIRTRVSDISVHPQSKGDRRNLLVRREGGDRILNLQPDLLLTLDTAGVTKFLIIDTKWKRFDKYKKATPLDADLYQMYAYLKRYECETVFLLYPLVNGAVTVNFDSVSNTGAPNGTIGVRFINLNHKLWTPSGKEALCHQILRLIYEGFGLPLSL